jgi:hypothetical protein
MAAVNEGLRARWTRPDLPRVEIYGDESMDRGPYDILGALWLRATDAAELRSDITRAREASGAENPYTEIKWNRCSGKKPNRLFLNVMDIALARIQSGRAKFKCMVIERALVDNKAWNAGDVELGFFKAWHTLLRSRIIPGLVYHVRLDARQLQKAERLGDLKNVLNACARADHGIDHRAFASVESRDSAADDLVQVVDVLTGAVGFHYSRGDLVDGASRRKVEMAAHIAGRIGARNLRFASGRSEQSFNIWRWKPKAGLNLQ